MISRYQEFGLASRVLTPAERHDCARSTEALKQFQRQEVVEFVKEHAGQPLLYSYSRDCTSTSLHTTSCLSTDSLAVTRKGRTVQEFLMQRGVFRGLPGSSSKDVCMLFGEPRPMSHGKGQWFVFTAATEFCKLPRSLGHCGCRQSPIERTGEAGQATTRRLL